MATTAQAPSSHCIQAGNNRALITVLLSATEQYYFRPRVLFQGGADGVACVGASSITYESPIRYVFDAVGVLGGKLASFNAPCDVGMVGEEYYSLGQWTGDVYPGYYDFDGEPLGSYDPEWTLFTFTAPDGTQYKFDSNGKLAQRIDRNNNSLTYTLGSTTGSIAHNSTKQVQFTIASGRITEIKDPIAIASSGPAAIKYNYDASGHMTDVARLINRAGSGTYENTGYFYDDDSNPHLITRVIDPRGITTVSNSYDSFGRDGVAPAGETAFRRFTCRATMTSTDVKSNFHRGGFSGMRLIVTPPAMN